MVYLKVVIISVLSSLQEEIEAALEKVCSLLPSTIRSEVSCLALLYF